MKRRWAIVGFTAAFGCGGPSAPPPQAPPPSPVASNAPPPSAPVGGAVMPTLVAVPIDLPRSSEIGTMIPPLGAAGGAGGVILVVDIARDGGLTVNASPLHDDRELVERARAAHERQPDVRVVLLADSSTTYGRIIQVMDLCKQGGIALFAFGVEPAGTVSGSGAPTVTRFADVAGSTSWSCAFPLEADKNKIDSAAVVVRVLVGPSGKPERVDVLNDPGFGFGEAARTCAMARTYRPARDDSGKPITAPTRPIRIRYER